MAFTDIISGFLMTKEKRQEMFGCVSGGSGSKKPENYQRKVIITETGYSCDKTNIRINLRTNLLENLKTPYIKENGFDYSEDFDGIQIMKNKTFYINLKCIVGKGGMQTRSLKEVYWFISGQLNVLCQTENIYFVNILDGNEAHSCMSKYNYIVNLPEFLNIKNKIYIGDLKDYIEWFKKVNEE